MNEKSSLSPQIDLKPKIRKRIVQVIIQVVVTGAFLFLSAWSLTWFWAWFYMALSLFSLLINGYVLLKYNPEVVAERADTKAGRKSWDKVWGAIFALLAVPGSMIVAGLDYRFGWTQPYALNIHVLGIVFFFFSGALFLWAMVANKFFAKDVRLQKERQQTVATSGPYRYVRHPGYVGLIVGLIAVQLLLGTLWGLIPAGLASLALVIRTALEDKTLHAELTGYTEFAAKTRYRLLPGVW